MFKSLLFASSLALSIPALPTQGRCFEYEPSIVEMSGDIRRQTFPGPPNYESIEQGDKPEIYWILHLAQPVCVNASPRDDSNVAEAGVTMVQLMVPDYRAHRRLVGKKAVARGRLMHGFSGHHNTTILLQVDSLIGQDRLRPMGDPAPTSSRGSRP